ncbi:hypothetical protein D8M06_09315 [Oceanobacillus halophilus]|uniref:Uncharacterized protein n=1 Tax=Oceanobacillus halophilus TaxID=930130 RepID=A0A495A3I6_9BACI|nr:hypothetical protein D8M06_09315 [Oceanobacillus halophilus]
MIKEVTVIKHFKNTRYWMIMPPFLLTAIIIFFFIPREFRGYYPLFVIIIFWLIYYTWNYIAKKKRNSDT